MNKKIEPHDAYYYVETKGKTRKEAGKILGVNRKTITRNLKKYN